MGAPHHIPLPALLQAASPDTHGTPAAGGYVPSAGDRHAPPHIAGLPEPTAVDKIDIVMLGAGEDRWGPVCVFCASGPVHGVAEAGCAELCVAWDAVSRAADAGVDTAEEVVEGAGGAWSVGGVVVGIQLYGHSGAGLSEIPYGLAGAAAAGDLPVLLPPCDGRGERGCGEGGREGDCVPWGAGITVAEELDAAGAAMRTKGEADGAERGD